MKLVRTLLLVSCLHVSFSQASAVVQQSMDDAVVVAGDFRLFKVNRVTIDAQKEVIKAYFRRNMMTRVAIRSTALALGVAALGYYLYNRSVPVSEKDIKIVLDQKKGEQLLRVAEAAVDNKKRLDGMEHNLEAIGAALNVSLPYKSDTPPVQPSFWQTLVQHLVSGAIVTTLVEVLVMRDIPKASSLIDKYFIAPIRRVNHERTLDWFLMTQIKFKKLRWVETYRDGSKDEKTRLDSARLFKNSARTAYVLPLASDESERVHYVSSLVKDINSMTRQIARIIAFCELRTETITPENRTCGKHLKEVTTFILRLTDKFVIETSGLLASKESHAKIPALVSEFQFKLDEQLETFHMYEEAAAFNFVPST